MVTVRRTKDYLAHAGVKGMKWGYNDGSRNGRRTAAELKNVANAIAEYNKTNKDPNAVGSGDVEGDYHEANNMLKYLGITLDLQSDDKKVAETMAIYNQMKNTKDNYKSQHEWLKAFSGKLSSAGYDMAAVDKMLDENKDKLNVMKTGTGTGNREKSNQDWKENDAKASKTKKSSGKSSKSKSSSTSSKSKSSTSTSSPKKSSSEKAETKEKATAKPKTVTSSIKTAKSNDAGVESMHKYKARRIKDPIQKSKTLSRMNHSEINQNGVEMYHWGIPGMKWGVRRYQNSDGSLTDEGRKHYGYKAARSNDEVAKLTGKSKGNSASDFNQKEFNKAVGNTKNTARVLNKYADKYERNQYKKKIKDMSDEELEREIQKALPEYQAKVMRQQLEQRYERVVGNPNSTKAGREKALMALDVIGDVAIISGSIYSISKMIKRK